MAIKSYSDLAVYATAKANAVEVNRLLDTLPHRERYRIVDQLGRSSAAPGALIAEGWGRKDSDADFKRYLRMALGEVQETKYWLELCQELGYLETTQARRLWKSYDELGAQLYSMIARWT